MYDILTHPWPWYVTGPLIGLVVPMLLLIGNRPFGISSSLRHICAACMPGQVAYFRYNWREGAWNLVFVTGIAVGGWVAATWLTAPGTITPVTPAFAAELARFHINPHQYLLPAELFNWHRLSSLPTLMVTVFGGLLIGFGARYAGGCTGGHSIMGLATLQRASLIATLAFLAGGFLMANLVLPLILG
jgi:uncharacterized membrane protein YedE/YeeE